jgi:hypothetical protein
VKTSYFEIKTEYIFLFKIASFHWATEAHTCNPSYLEARDQEVHSVTPALGK